VAKLEVLHWHFNGKADEEHEIYQPEVGGLLAGIWTPKFSDTNEAADTLYAVSRCSVTIYWWAIRLMAKTRSRIELQRVTGHGITTWVPSIYNLQNFTAPFPILPSEWTDGADFLSSGMWRRVGQYKCAFVSEELAASITHVDIPCNVGTLLPNYMASYPRRDIS